MATLTTDTYKIPQKLQSKGYTKEQAEGFIEVIQDVNLDEVATKGDVQAVKNDIQTLRADINLEMKNLALEIKYDILKWVIPLIFGLYGLIIFKIH